MSYPQPKPGSLAWYADRAIAEENAAFLADPPAQQKAADEGERWRHIMDAERAAGPHAVVLPVATARLALAYLRGEDPGSPIDISALTRMLEGHLAKAAARPAVQA